MKRVVIFGAGGHAKVVADIIEKVNNYHIVGFIDQFKRKGDKVYGYDIVGDESFIEMNSTNLYGGIVAIGDNWLRAKIVATILLKVPHFKFITAIHPTAHLARG